MTPEELQKKNRAELLELAKSSQIKNRSSMSKEQLIDTIIQSSAGNSSAEKTKHVPQVQQIHWTESQQSAPVPQGKVAVAEMELPFSYNQTRVVLMVRDPYWLYSYWDFSGETYHGLANLFGSWQNVPLTMRIYEVAPTAESGVQLLYDIPLDQNARSWYIHASGPNRSFVVDLGYLHPYEGFVVLCRSNVVTTPRDSISDIIDEEWMIIEEDFRRLYRLAGWGRQNMNSAEIVESLIKRLEREMGSGAVSSLSSPSRPVQKERGFWLVVDAELIVYGSTEPDAHVTIDGQPITLRPDGSFTLRTALPDGIRNIPVSAKSSDDIETITITPVVQRTTHSQHVKKEER